MNPIQNRASLPLFIIFIIFGLFSFKNQFAPLEGVHKIRQADTLFAGMSFCLEKSSFFEPKIIQRGANPGISIGELPVFSYLISIPCQLTGTWNESAPKLINFFFLLLGMMVWFQILQQLCTNKISFFTFSIFYFFSTNAIVHYQIPIPDHFALFVMGGAIWIDLVLRRQDHEPSKILQVLGSLMIPIIFTIAFLIRPYLIPLIALFLFPIKFDVQSLMKRSFWSSLFLALAGYFLWYKWWAPQHSTLFYYNTTLVSPHDLITQWSGILKGFYEQTLRSYCNFVGAFLIGFYLIQKHKLFRHNHLTKSILILAMLSYLFVVLIKGDHGTRHGYYFSGFFIYITFAFTLICEDFLNTKWKTWTLYLFVLIGIGNTQHYFHGKFQPYFNELVQLREHIPQNALVATYAATESNDPVELYALQRFGVAMGRTDLPESTRAAMAAATGNEISAEFCPRKIGFILLGELESESTNTHPSPEKTHYKLFKCILNPHE